jgi:hypothetical protein
LSVPTPLFVEELTAVLESEGQSQAVLTAAPAPAHAVPATLHAALMARLDRLGPTAKEIAEIGAVLGREFTYELIEAVARRPKDELRTALGQLGDAELLFCRGTPPHASYMFKHALVLDAAYSTLLRGQRQELHSRAATALERHFADLVERQPELLAHHRTGAGETAAAVAQWLKAGQRSAARSAHAEAIVYIGHGLTMLGTLPETPERDDLNWIFFARAGSIMATKVSWRRNWLTSIHAPGLAEQGMTQTTGSPRCGASSRQYPNRVSYSAIDLSDKLLILTGNNGEDGLRLQAHHAAWSTCLWTGDTSRALPCEAAELLRYRTSSVVRHDLWRPRSGAPGRPQMGAGWLVATRSIRSSYDDAIRLAEQLSHLLTLMIAYSFAAVVEQFRREPELAA